jgi:hypothetical protein
MALYVINAVVLARYFMAFLTPKHGGPFWAAFGMGAGYLLLQGAVEFLLTRFFTGTVPTLFRTGIAAIFLFILSLLLYRREIGKQLFLLFSFFAIYRISIFLYVLMNAVLPLSSWLVGVLLSNETMLAFRTHIRAVRANVLNLQNRVWYIENVSIVLSDKFFRGIDSYSIQPIYFYITMLTICTTIQVWIGRNENEVVNANNEFAEN